MDPTDDTHEVAKDISSEAEARELCTTRLEVDVGERTAEFGTRSLLQLATAVEDDLDSILANIDRGGA